MMDAVEQERCKQRWLQLGFSVRVANCLANDGISSLEDLKRRLQDGRLLLMPNFGRRSLQEVHDVLREARTDGPAACSREQAWRAYLSILTQREVNALELAFKAGWQARDAAD